MSKFSSKSSAIESSIFSSFSREPKPGCGGGGGIPVTERDRQYNGIPSVIDKDRLSSLLAVDLEAEALIILS